MKIHTLTIFAALILTAGITKTTYAVATANENVTTLTNISAINKIEVHGNVKLYISDGTADEVKVYNKYYAESALVQSKNGVLSIASYTAEKLVVWVTVNDLRAVSAYDNAEVKSFGDISKIEFDVDLYNNAFAHLTFDAYAASVKVSDQAKADLNGYANEFTLNSNIASNVNKNNFFAVHFMEHKTIVAAEIKGDDMAGF